MLSCRHLRRDPGIDVSHDTELNAAIAAHWSRRDPLAWIVARLEAEGLAAPGWRDVARFDQIHAGGLRAVRQLATLAMVAPGMRIVDLGGGLGGAARFLAAEHGADVACIDLTEALVDAGSALTRLVGLQGRVEHVLADATAVPLPDASCDGVWVQHLALHLPEPGRLWAEAARLLKPGGWLAFHEWVLGGAGAPYYPAPWAPADGSLSFLAPREAFLGAIAAAGFARVEVRDVSAAMAEAYARQAEALARGGDSPVLAEGEALAVVLNAERSLREGRAACLMGVAQRLHGSR